MPEQSENKTEKKQSKNIIVWISAVLLVLIVAGLATWLIWSKSKAKELASTGTKIEDSYSGPFIDTHAHLITKDYTFDQAIAELTKYNVSKMIIMETPVDLSTPTPSSLHGIPEAQNYNQFAMMYQGEAIELLHQVVKRGTYTEEEQNRFVALIEEAAQSGKFVGFGELALRHYPQANLKGARREARDITIDGNHSWMNLLAQTGAKYGLPLDIHIEPDESTLPGFEKLIAANPNTKFIFDHAGWYNTGEGTPELFDRMLETYPNLYVSIKIRRPIDANQEKVAIFDKNEVLKDSWKKVFIKHQGRFMCGSDVKLGLADGGEDGVSILGQYPKLLKQLPYETAEKIATQNAKLLFKID